MPDLSVDGQREPKLAKQADVAGVEQCQVRADGAERAERLPLVELRLRDLHVARRVVVHDHGPGDELVQVAFGDVDRPPDGAPQDQPELDLVVEEPHAPGPDHVAVGRHDAARRLGEDHVEGLRVGVHARLDHVLAVVRALADELLVVRHRREDRDVVQRLPCRRRAWRARACRSRGSDPRWWRSLPGSA